MRLQISHQHNEVDSGIFLITNRIQLLYCNCSEKVLVQSVLLQGDSCLWGLTFQKIS